MWPLISRKYIENLKIYVEKICGFAFILPENKTNKIYKEANF